MPTHVLMPALSPTMEQGKLTKWLKKEGDTVKSGDVIAEIETDKATMEVEAVDEGVLAKILVGDGTENVAVNTPIAVIAGEGEDAAAASKAALPAKLNGGGADEPRPGLPRDHRCKRRRPRRNSPPRPRATRPRPRPRQSPKCPKARKW